MAQPKKIAIVGPARPFRGGIAHFTGELAGALRRRGHHVTLETFSRQYPALLFPGKTQLEPDQGELPDDTIAQLDSINPLTWRSTGNRIKREAYDLVRSEERRVGKGRRYRGRTCGSRSKGK